MFLLSPVHSQQTVEKNRIVRIGIYPFEPICFIDDAGRAEGFYPDLLQEIAREAGWKVRYEEGTWAEGLDQLQDGTIDLVMGVIRSDEREKIMDFSQVSSLELWGQVFIRPDSPIKKINDLQDKTVGVVRGDMVGQILTETADLFNVTLTLKEYETYQKVFQAIESGEVAAGAAYQYYGLKQKEEYDIIDSSILYSPVSIYFTVKKGENADLLQEIDRLLNSWKGDKESVYYEYMWRWMSPEDLKREVVPVWIKITMALALFLGLLTAAAFS